MVKAKNELKNGSKKLKILFIASEAAPFAKAGGLGDVMRSLPLALRKLGQDARVMIPKYGTIDEKRYNIKMELKGLRVPTDQPGPNPYLICNVKKYSGKKFVPTFFLENMEYYEKRANVYGYSDDHIRWVLFNRGVIEFLKKSKWIPDIVVASDWQTGLFVNYLKTTYSNDPILSKIPVVYSIHNMHYQGMCDFRFTPESEKDAGRESIPDFFNPRLAKLNWLLRGIMYSDVITTVSPTYAKEITTPEYGEGLDKILSEKREKIYGILNGIDYEKYNPLKSPHIPVNYSLESPNKRNENKTVLQKKFGLPQNKNVFLLGIVSRLTEQKGFDLLEKIIYPLLENLNIQLICLGDGEPRYKEMLQKASEKFPEKLKYFFQFDYSLPHLIFAGADSILIPSKFEPCGIVQMQAMRYGTVPIARKTGGLAETVKNFSPEKMSGNGFLFTEYEPMALYTSIVKAENSFHYKKHWQKLVRNAMKEDFSWTKSAKKYLDIFNKLKK